MCGASVWSKRAHGSHGIFWYMEVFGYAARSRRSGRGFARVRGWCLSAEGRLLNKDGAFENGRLSHYWWASASRRAGVNCRTVLRGSSSGAGIRVVGRSCLECPALHTVGFKVFSMMKRSLRQSVSVTMRVRRTLVRYRTCFGFASSRFQSKMSVVRCFTSLLSASKFRGTIRV